MKKIVGLMAFVLVFGGLVGGAMADDLVEVEREEEWGEDIVAGESFEWNFSVTWHGEENGTVKIDTNVTDDNGTDVSHVFNISYVDIFGERIEPGETMDGVMEVETDPALIPDNYKFNTTVEVETDKIYGVEVEAPENQEEGSTGTKTYNFVVRNTGSIEDTYDLTVEDTEGWDVSVQDNVTVGPWSEDEVGVEVTIPSVSDGTTSEVTLTAENQTNDTVSDSDTMEVTLDRPPTTHRIDLDPQPDIEVTDVSVDIVVEDVPADVEISYTVENAGYAEGIEEITVTVGDEEIDTREHELGAGEEETVSLTHTFDERGLYTVTAGQAETEVDIPRPEVPPEEAEDAVSEAQETIDEGEAGYDTLQEAIGALEAGNYEEAVEFASQALEEWEDEEVVDEPPVEAPGITGRIVESPGMFIFGVVAVMLLLAYGGYGWMKE